MRPEFYADRLDYLTQWQDTDRSGILRFKKELKLVLLKNPGLDEKGFSDVLLFDDSDYEKFISRRKSLFSNHLKILEVRNWLANNIRPLKNVNKIRTTEDMLNVLGYFFSKLTKGQFISAAILAGYKMKKYKGEVFFGMSEADWKYVE